VRCRDIASSGNYDAQLVMLCKMLQASR